MKKFLCFLFLVITANSANACITCNKMIREGIYNSQFLPNLLTMFSAFIVLAIFVSLFASISNGRYKSRKKTNPHLVSSVPLTSSSLVLGIGIGGFVDGIFLHQILQWHEMISAKIPSTDYVGKSVNMFWDGIFHFFCLLVVLTGVILLWKLSRRKEVNFSGLLLAGGLIAGWGLFNIVEGLINHQWLKLHNVMEFSMDPKPANLIFLGLSVLLLLLGFVLIRKGGKENLRDHASPV